MNKRALALALLVMASAAAPTPAPQPSMPSFSATGTMNLKGQTPDGKSGTVQIQMRVAHRNLLTRVDVLRIVAAADDPNANTMMAQFIPKGTITVVVDQSKSLLTIWSSSHPYYYQSKLAVPKPTQKNNGKSSSSSIWTAISNGLSSMTKYDSYSSSIDLTGHKTVNGHTASVFAFTHKSQKHGEPAQTSSGTFALADDLNGIPLHADVTATGGPVASVSADLTQVSTSAPPASTFAIPKGYKKTTQLMNVLMETGRVTMP